MPELRSRRWFDGDDETALAHRVAVRMAGRSVERGDPAPVVAIIDTSSEFNPCNLPLVELAPLVADGVAAAGGVPLVTHAMSLGEDLMKPSAMLYRNLLAMEVEELIRANPVDGIVLLVNCDKTTPGALMGALSSDLPTIVVVGGHRPPPQFRGRRIGTGTDLWRVHEERRRGLVDDAAWAEFERVSACGTGTCNTMGTASTMALVAEALGFVLPGGGSVQAGSDRARSIARLSGERIVPMIEDSLIPSRISTPAAFRNAARVLHAIGGSTNAVLHLTALAGRVGHDIGPEQICATGIGVPVVADVEPAGSQLMSDFDAAGGLPAVVAEIAGALEPAETCTGAPLVDAARAAEPGTSAIRPSGRALADGPAIRHLSGTLAPKGAVLKSIASSQTLWRHRGPALVFDGYEEMRARLDDPDLDVTPDHVLVLRGCGPVGVPGMPEWGMMPIPRRLAAKGVHDMVRVTDARMSGTSYGTCILHCTPEAAVGGPLAAVEDGDLIELDVLAGRLDLLVDTRLIAERLAERPVPAETHLRGWPALYRRTVLQADKGADLDFLTAPTPEHRRWVEPVVGRS